MTVPSLFVSHGAPTFAIEPGLAGAQLHALGLALGKPRGIVVVSPHWMTRGVAVTASARPPTIHDFGGFPAALYSLQYPAPGDRALAARAAQLLQVLGKPVRVDEARGLDHGAWVPLLHMYPDADVPVVQVSLPHDSTAATAYALGRALAPLAQEGVLVIGSGSLTHNLYEFRTGEVKAADYAVEFTHWIRDAVQRGDTDALLRALQDAPHAQRAHPTSDHFLPLLVATGAATDATPHHRAGRRHPPRHAGHGVLPVRPGHHIGSAGARPCLRARSSSTRLQNQRGWCCCFTVWAPRRATWRRWAKRLPGQCPTPWW